MSDGNTTGKRLLLISNSTLHGSAYLDHAEAELRDVLGKTRRVLFVPFALHDRAAYAAQAQARFGAMGYALHSLHEATDPTAAVDWVAAAAEVEADRAAAAVPAAAGWRRATEPARGSTSYCHRPWRALSPERATVDKQWPRLAWQTLPNSSRRIRCKSWASCAAETALTFPSRAHAVVHVIGTDALFLAWRLRRSAAAGGSRKYGARNQRRLPCSSCR